MIATESPKGLVILGHPVAQSLSPLFQNAALAAAGLDVHYERRDTPPETLDDVLTECALRGIGGNVTMPLKEAMVARAARTSPAASRVGAVNTFWFERGDLVGHNTDVDGVHATLDALLPSGPVESVVLLGAGGSAAAALVALVERGVGQLTIAARTPSRARELLTRTDVCAAANAHVLALTDSAVPHALRRAALVINSTPVGMRDDALAVDVEALGDQTAVFDLVYRQDSTAFVRAARARGLRAEDGMRMLVEQGAAAFRCWFGIEAPRDVMWRALGASVPPRFCPRS